MRSRSCCVHGLGWVIVLLRLVIVSPAHAESDHARAPSRCVQLGGPLACKPAIATAWVYRADGKSYADEASAYASMLQAHAPKSVFSLTQRWGQGDRATQTLPARYDHSIEVASWKLFLHCIPRDANAPCEPQSAYPGYQRIRKIVCPAGFQFSSDTESSFCLPVETGTVQAAPAQPTLDPAATTLNPLAARNR